MQKLPASKNLGRTETSATAQKESPKVTSNAIGREDLTSKDAGFGLASQKKAIMLGVAQSAHVSRPEKTKGMCSVHKKDKLFPMINPATGKSEGRCLVCITEEQGTGKPAHHMLLGYKVGMYGAPRGTFYCYLCHKFFFPVNDLFVPIHLINEHTHWIDRPYDGLDGLESKCSPLESRKLRQSTSSSNHNISDNQ